jgi:hypothetical protein
MTSAELAAVPEPADPVDAAVWIYRGAMRRSNAADALRLCTSLTTEALGWITRGRVYFDAGAPSQLRMWSIGG